MADYISRNNPTRDFTVEGPDDNGKYWIGVREYCSCGHPCCSRPETEIRRHTSAPEFDEPDEAADWIENVGDRWEDDYDQYLEENRHAIVQSERYEMFMRER